MLALLFKRITVNHSVVQYYTFESHFNLEKNKKCAFSDNIF